MQTQLRLRAYFVEGFNVWPVWNLYAQREIDIDDHLTVKQLSSGTIILALLFWLNY